MVDTEWVIARTKEILAKRPKGALGIQGDLRVEITLAPGDPTSFREPAAEGEIWVTATLVIVEDAAVRDVKEQMLLLVPDATDEPARLQAYLEGWVAAAGAFLAESDPDTLLPHDLVAPNVAANASLQTAADFEAAIATRLRQGSADLGLIGDLSGTEPIAEDAALEAAIAEDPEQVPPYLVYADWLIERGDPRGELIACQRPDADGRAGLRARALLEEHRRYFYGNLPFDADTEAGVQVTWLLGYFDTVRVAADYDLWDKSSSFVEDALRAVFTMPSGRFLRRLIVGCFNFEGDNDYDAIYELLGEFGPRPSLTALHLGDMTSEDQEVSWVAGGDLDKLATLYPNVRDFHLRAGSMTSLRGALTKWPKLKRLVLETGGLKAENVRAVGEVTMPNAEHVELWTGSRYYEGDSSLDDLTALFEGAGLPKVHTLALRNSEYADDIAGAIGRAKILPQLKVLDLSKGVLSDEGLAQIRAQAERFRHLERLDVSESFLSEDAIAELAKADVKVVSTGQRQTYGDGERYVSLSE